MKTFCILVVLALTLPAAPLPAQCAGGSCGIRGAIRSGDGPVRRVVRAKPVRSLVGKLLPRNR